MCYINSVCAYAAIFKWQNLFINDVNALIVINERRKVKLENKKKKTIIQSLKEIKRTFIHLNFNIFFLHVKACWHVWRGKYFLAREKNKMKTFSKTNERWIHDKTTHVNYDISVFRLNEKWKVKEHFYFTSHPHYIQRCNAIRD